MKRLRACALIEAAGVLGRNPLLEPLREELARRRIELVVWDPAGALVLPPAAPDADIYLLKADDPVTHAAAGCLHDQGARCLNAFPATEAARDKARTLARLAQAAIPVPRTRVVGGPEELASALEDGPCFVKPLRGAHGNGARRVGPGQVAEAGPGPWLVQELVGDGTNAVLKVYGVGPRVAVRRMRFLQGLVDAPREPAPDADPAAVELARSAAAATGLVCYGADFLAGRDGPVLVDLNAFPGYRSVEEAPAWVADAVEEALRA